MMLPLLAGTEHNQKLAAVLSQYAVSLSSYQRYKPVRLAATAMGPTRCAHLFSAVEDNDND